MTKRERVHRWIWWQQEKLEDWLCNRKWAKDWMFTQTGHKISYLLCAILGHRVVDDQCRIPLHRYCTYCYSPKPGEPVDD